MEKTFTQESFQVWLKEEQKSGKTLRQLGEMFGVTDMAVYYWARGMRKPHGSVIRLASSLAQKD